MQILQFLVKERLMTSFIKYDFIATKNDVLCVKLTLLFGCINLKHKILIAPDKI